MKEPDNLRDLVGEDLSPEELARLERVDSLLRSVPAPPPELPASLTRSIDTIGLEALRPTRAVRDVQGRHTAFPVEAGSRFASRHRS